MTDINKALLTLVDQERQASALTNLDSTSLFRTALDALQSAVSETDANTAISTPYVREVLADSPVAYWRLGESSGTTATDASGNAHNGTYAASISLGQTGAISDGDTAVAFTGSTANYISVTQDDALTPAAISVEAWIKPAATQANSAPRITSDLSGTAGYLFSISQTAPYNLTLNIQNVSNRDCTKTGVLSANTLYHVVATYSGQVTTLYVNGVQVKQTDFGSVLAMGTNAVNLFIGNAGGAGTDRAFNGMIDEVAIYNTVLSPARIRAHYAARYL